MKESLESKFSKTDKAILHDMHGTLKRIDVTLFGDEPAGIKGIVKVTHENSEGVKEYKKDKVKVLAFFSIISTLVAGLWAWFLKKG